jgi:hypothetical protein
MLDAGLIKTSLSQKIATINAANLKKAHGVIETGRSAEASQESWGVFRQPPLHYLTRSVRRTSGFVLADPTGR